MAKFIVYQTAFLISQSNGTVRTKAGHVTDCPASGTGRTGHTPIGVSVCPAQTKFSLLKDFTMSKITHEPSIVWPKIFEMISEGRSLTGALKRLTPSPGYNWAKVQLRNNPDLKAEYDAACKDRADRLVDDLLEIVDAPIPEGLDSGARTAYVNHLRLKLDTRKWIACKFNPRIYGDKMNLDVTSTQISISAVLAEANKRVANFIEGEVVQPKVEVR
jgi:hypothetical protein